MCTSHAEDAELAVLDGGTGRFFGNATRAQVVGVKSMIGDQNHSRVRAGQSEQSFQHHVVEAVGAVYDILVNFEAVLWNAFHSRRMEVHEAVTEVIDAVV